MVKTVLLLFLEILPLLIFFTLGQYLPFLQALMGYIIVTILVIGLIWHIQKRISFLALIFGGFIIVAGSLSIWFSNPSILQLADTLYYISAALGIGILSLFKINVIQLLFDHTFGMSKQGWKILNYRWMIALALAGISNEIVRQLGTTDDWLKFQLLRTLILVLFAAYQFTLTKRHRLPSATPWGIVITK